jgi:frataxin
MSDKNFHHLCDNFLESLAQKLEEWDKNSALDVEYSDGILTINLENSGKTYVINRHSATQKIWYSSPISGADYFSFNENAQKWLDSKGEEIEKKLLEELERVLN